MNQKERQYSGVKGKKAAEERRMEKWRESVRAACVRAVNKFRFVAVDIVVYRACINSECTLHTYISAHIL